MASKHHTILIAGGSVAGLATSIYAHLHGLDAAIIEPRRPPMDKACGEGLLPGTMRLLDEMGVVIREASPLRGISYHRDERSVHLSFPGEPGYGIRRTELYRALHERAEQLGVKFVEARVLGFEHGMDKVTVHTDQNTLTASFLVGADGLKSSVRKILGIPKQRWWSPRYGVRQHFAMKPWSQHVEVYWHDDFEIYVTPLGPNLIGVACLFFGSLSFESCLAKIPSLRERLTDPCSRLLGSGPFECRLPRRSQGRVHLVGDAAGFIDPMTGEGNRLAIGGARALIASISEGEPALYERRWRALTRGYRYLTSIMLLGTRPHWVRRHLLSILQFNPFLMRYFMAQLLTKPHAPLLLKEAH